MAISRSPTTPVVARDLSISTVSGYDVPSLSSPLDVPEISAEDRKDASEEAPSNPLESRLSQANDDTVVRNRSGLTIQTATSEFIHDDYLHKGRRAGSCDFYSAGKNSAFYEPRKPSHTEKSSEITQAEYTNLYRMFHAYDADGSGAIDGDELGHVMQGLGVPMTDDELLTLLREHGSPLEDDEEGEYGIEFSEFVELMAKHKERLLDTGRQEDMISNQYILETTLSQFYSVDSPLRWFLDLLLFLAAIYYGATVPLRYVYNIYGNEMLQSCIVEGGLHILFAVDIYVRFNTIPMDAEEDPQVDDPLTMRRSQIASNYLQTNLLPDLLSSLPTEFFFDQNATSAHICRSFKLIKILRVPFLYATSGSLGVLTPTCISFLYSIVPMVNMMFCLSIVQHWCTILWMYLTLTAEKAAYDGTQGVEYDVLNHTLSTRYLNSFYTVLYTVTTVGYGDVEVRTSEQKIFACFLFICGVVVNGFVVSKINRLLSRSDITSERKAKMVEMVNLLHYFKIPRNIQREILAFQHHLLDHNLSSAYSEIIDALPVTMQDQLSLYLKLKLVSQVPLFLAVHEECKVAIAQSLRNTVAQPNEFIICAGEIGNEMYFLGYGVAQVLRPNGQHLATIRKGQFFGEMALVFARDGDSKRTASIRALTYCDLYCLMKVNFLEILSRFPKFRQMVDKEATLRRENMPSPPPKRKLGPARPVVKIDDSEIASSVATSQGVQSMREEPSPEVTFTLSAKEAFPKKKTSFKNAQETEEEEEGGGFVTRARSGGEDLMTKHSSTSLQSKRSRTNLGGDPTLLCLQRIERAMSQQAIKVSDQITALSLTVQGISQEQKDLADLIDEGNLSSSPASTYSSPKGRRRSKKRG